ncbi:hypothetical protein PPL_04756 [Heterostelium album PN500]|uniref:Tc1-like transposase DDE domain-containing protein n=1 Tax=Heterostelium pallidum (strain ATCC 26659 / Pp 5 / PN500) TaxID=670386 RepID=D3B8G3_HETP5|nr:hypothetical protein PPL_04756 [Heterostelium album PN500]EFA82331.1 hypothetical protein PPL_04756 [Heterostelium album PN500]|eukprot:XP_020434448.1 hypothetical protein PPL_04756 [Heterostelium album PN500]
MSSLIRIEEKIDYVNGIPFTNKKPTTRGGRAETIGVVCAVTGRKILMARSQFGHFTNDAFRYFFRTLLQKLDKEYPNQSFTFIGDNEGIYKDALSLLSTDKYKRHRSIPNPRFSPFLNSIEYLFNQLKANVRGGKYRTIGDLSLEKSPIHSWRVTLDNKVKALDPPERQWDYAHQTIFMASKERLDTPLAKDDDKNQPKESNNFMWENGQKVFIYKQNEEPTSSSVTTKNKTTAKKPTKTTKRLPKKLKKSTKTTKKST